MEVRPNGNLVIEGHRSLATGDEESILTLFGEIDPDDIHPLLRSVRSERIGDLKLSYSGRGVVSRNNGRTFFSYLLEFLWPF